MFFPLFLLNFIKYICVLYVFYMCFKEDSDEKSEVCMVNHASTVWHSRQPGGKEVMEDAVAQLSKMSTP